MRFRVEVLNSEESACQSLGNSDPLDLCDSFQNFVPSSCVPEEDSLYTGSASLFLSHEDSTHGDTTTLSIPTRGERSASRRYK